MSRAVAVIIARSGGAASEAADIGIQMVKKLEQEFDSQTLRIILCSVVHADEEEEDKESVVSQLSCKHQTTMDNNNSSRRQQPSDTSVNSPSSCLHLVNSLDEKACFQQLFDFLTSETATATTGNKNKNEDDDDEEEDGGGTTGRVDLLINLTSFVDPENRHQLSITSNYEFTRNLTDTLSPLMKDNGQIILLSRPVTLFHLIGPADTDFDQEARSRVLAPDAQRADLDAFLQSVKQRLHDANSPLDEDTISHIMIVLYTIILRQELHQEKGNHVEVTCVCYGRDRDAAQVADMVVETITTPEKDDDYLLPDNLLTELSCYDSDDSLASMDSRNKLRLISWILSYMG